MSISYASGDALHCTHERPAGGRSTVREALGWREERRSRARVGSHTGVCYRSRGTAARASPLMPPQKRARVGEREPRAAFGYERIRLSPRALPEPVTYVQRAVSLVVAPTGPATSPSTRAPSPEEPR